MPIRDIITIGTSAGGVETLSRVVKGFPPGLPATIFVVCHVPPYATSKLPEILNKSGPLLAQHARDGEPTYPGQIYVAPPDYHMLVRPGGVQLGHGPRENGHRPAIDTLFLSASRVYGARVIGVILTGALSDGVAGLMAVRNGGGLGITQEPKDSVVAELPAKALEIAGADFVVPSAQMAAKLTQLIQWPIASPGGLTMDPNEKMSATVSRDLLAQQLDRRQGEITTFTCPDCGGSLWQFSEDPVGFRCHLSHTFYGQTLLEEQSQALEGALWSAVRSFRERAILCRQLAGRSRRTGDAEARERFEDEAQQSENSAELICRHILRCVLPGGPTGVGPTFADPEQEASQEGR